jgi:hypothetical protein
MYIVTKNKLDSLRFLSSPLIAIILLLSSVFFFFLRHWELNSGPCACYERLYHLSNTPSPFVFSFIFRQVHTNFPWTASKNDPPTSASQIAWILDVPHPAQPRFLLK